MADELRLDRESRRNLSFDAASFPSEGMGGSKRVLLKGTLRYRRDFLTPD
jgi:hypothetical protein